LLSVKKNREEFPIELSLSAFKTKDRWDAACIINDITDRRAMQERLLKSEKFAAIGELANMVAHDLRNPLTSIKGAVYFLEARCSKDFSPKAKEMFSTIDKSINYSNKIINDLLEYSREIKLELTDTNPKSLLTSALFYLAVPENITILDKTEINLPLKVDTVKMERVFTNLIKNAFDAMPEGGVLTVESKETEENVELTFRDTGIGMTNETKDRLFTPLFTTKAKGMGFGLAICKRLIEAHQGTIIVESELGQGACFKIFIPSKQRIDDDLMFSMTQPEPLIVGEPKARGTNSQKTEFC